MKAARSVKFTSPSASSLSINWAWQGRAILTVLITFGLLNPWFTTLARGKKTVYSIR